MYGRRPERELLDDDASAVIDFEHLAALVSVSQESTIRAQRQARDLLQLIRKLPQRQRRIGRNLVEMGQRLAQARVPLREFHTICGRLLFRGLRPSACRHRGRSEQ